MTDKTEFPGRYETFLDACARGDVAAVQKFLCSGVDKWEKRGVEKRNALHCACERGHAAVVKVLLRAGIGVNSVDRHGVTPLLIASGAGSEETVRLLLDSGAKVNKAATGRHPETPLFVASNNGHRGVVAMLLQAGANRAEMDATPLIMAVKGYHGDIVEELNREGVNVNGRDEHGDTPLIAAVEFHDVGSLRMTQYLLRAGADPNLAGSQDWTPLFMACERGGAMFSDYVDSLTRRAEFNRNLDEIAEELLAAGADPNKLSRGKFTPLMGACCVKRVEMVKRLLRIPGLDLDVTSDRGLTAYGIATHEGNACPEIAKALLDAGADPEMRDEAAMEQQRLWERNLVSFKPPVV
jgi:ankyrin repeat protein